MPFITEELWQHIYDRKEGESLMVQQLNIPTVCNEIIVKEFEVVKEVIGGIRTIRLQKNIAQKETLELQVVDVNPVATFNPVITKLCNLSSIEAVENKADGSGSFMVGTTEYAIPLGNLINTEEELAKLEADLKYQEGFLQSVLKKLSNEKFVSKAPANVIDMERKKQADAESKIASLKESIAALKNKKYTAFYRDCNILCKAVITSFLIKRCVKSNSAIVLLQSSDSFDNYFKF